MDSVLHTRLVRRSRSCPARPRRACSPMLFDALEERTLLSVAPIKDINPVNLGPSEITGAGGNVYFVAKAANGGADLDVQTDSGVTVLKEIPAPINDLGASTTITELTPAGSKLFFVVNGSNDELWVTDGTVAGTTQVALSQDVADQFGGGLTAAGSKVYFTVLIKSDNDSNLELFVSDGTTTGTVPVPPPAGSSTTTTTSADNLVGHDGVLYFSSDGQLLKTDGTVTTIVSTLATGTSSIPFINNMTDAGSSFYFTLRDASDTGESLYISDGTKQATKLLKTFKAAGTKIDAYDLVENLVAAGPKLYFIAADPAHGSGLWVSDGTAAGTKFVKSFGAAGDNAPYGSTFPGTPIVTMVAAGNRLFLETEAPGTAGSGLSLWVSNGTATGTTEVGGITPAQNGGWGASSLPYGQLAGLNGVLYFANDDPKHGIELWRSDGTINGTRLVRDLKPGPAGSYPGNMAVVGNTLYFSAATTADSSELWTTDGTAAGTTRAATLNPQENGDAVYRPDGGDFALLGNSIIFAANDGVHGTALWKTDGTSGGTTMLKVLNSNAYASAATDFTRVGKTLYFVTNGEDPKTRAATETLWKTNGTVAGTTRVLTDGKSIGATAAFNGKLTFLENNPDGSGLTLWTSDGTAHGTKQVRGFANMIGSYGESTSSLTVFQGKLYLVAPLSVNGEYAKASLWVSDGTTAGTKPVVAKPAFSGVQDLTIFQGKLFFLTSDSQPVLWSSNGTAAGTKRVATLATDSEEIVDVIASGSNLYIATQAYDDNDNPIGRLFRSSGTAKGTVLLHTFQNSFGMAGVGLPDGKLAFTVNSAATYDRVIWVSDGTKAGTVAVPGVDVTLDSASAVTIGGELYLQGGDLAHGTELWRTDGTIAGTTLVQDINPGPNSSNPYVLGAINGHLIVSADDGLHGTELFSLALPSKGTKNTKAH